MAFVVRVYGFFRLVTECQLDELLTDPDQDDVTVVCQLRCAAVHCCLSQAA